MSDLGKIKKIGALNPDNPVLAGGWTITWAPADLPRIGALAYHAAVQGPAGSRFQVWIDDTFYGNVKRGDIADWDPAQPMYIRPGDTVYYHFNTTATPAPKATLFLREPPAV